jgi:hypothetical protein
MIQSTVIDQRVTMHNGTTANWNIVEFHILNLTLSILVSLTFFLKPFLFDVHSYDIIQDEKRDDRVEERPVFPIQSLIII